MHWYAIASLTPAVLLALACGLGGAWPLAALVSVTGLVLGMDRWARPPRAGMDRAAHPIARHLPAVLALSHLVLLALGVRALAAGDALRGADWAMTFLALGLYLGQVANSNAHELIHRPDRWSRGLGKAVYVALLFGHHASAHPKVHHVMVASDGDPNSARPGESFYRFWPRAWIGSFRAGWAAENALRARAAHPLPRWSHPYVVYVGGGLAALATAAALGGMRGVLVLLALAGYAQMQLLLSDYVQHYGLRRHRRADGSLEPAGITHSWNAPHWYSAAMMLNAPRHSDHHMNPARGFAELRLDPGRMPVLPHALPVMGAAALWPPLWRRLMDRRVAKWRDRAHGADGARANDLAQSGHD